MLSKNVIWHYFSFSRKCGGIDDWIQLIHEGVIFKRQFISRLWKIVYASPHIPWNASLRIRDATMRLCSRRRKPSGQKSKGENGTFRVHGLWRLVSTKLAILHEKSKFISTMVAKVETQPALSKDKDAYTKISVYAPRLDACIGGWFLIGLLF